MTSNYCIIDLETSIKNTPENDGVGDMKASPFHPDNEIVMWGYKKSGSIPITLSIKDPQESLRNIDILVGHNIKFDCLYLYRSENDKYHIRTTKLWDTMIVEYLLTGQQSKFISLDKLAEKYEGTLKNDKIKEYWEAGIDTEDIPKSELREYLIGDLNNTEIVYLAQRKLAKHRNMLPLIESQMDALKAIIEMEYNGMRFDIRKAYELGKEVKADYDEIESTLIMYMASRGIKDPNPESNEHISLFLFGGVQTVKEQRPTYEEGHDLYRYKGGAKAGEIRTRYTPVNYSIRPFLVSEYLSDNYKEKTTKAFCCPHQVPI